MVLVSQDENGAIAHASGCMRLLFCEKLCDCPATMTAWGDEGNKTLVVHVLDLHCHRFFQKAAFTGSDEAHHTLLVFVLDVTNHLVKVGQFLTVKCSFF